MRRLQNKNVTNIEGKQRQKVKSLRKTITEKNLDAVILTSLQNVAYYSGFLYCSFGRPYACVVTDKRNIVVSANIDAVSSPQTKSTFEFL